MISIVQLIKFNHKYMHNHLSLNIQVSVIVEGRCIFMKSENFMKFEYSSIRQLYCCDITSAVPPERAAYKKLLYTPYISRGFYFREFRESGAIREFINTQKYLPPIPTHECDLCTQYIALLDREFNHSRKCLKFPIRKKLDSRNIWRIQ